MNSDIYYKIKIDNKTKYKYNYVNFSLFSILIILLVSLLILNIYNHNLEHVKDNTYINIDKFDYLNNSKQIKNNVSKCYNYDCINLIYEKTKVLNFNNYKKNMYEKLLNSKQIVEKDDFKLLNKIKNIDLFTKFINKIKMKYLEYEKSNFNHILKPYDSIKKIKLPFDLKKYTNHVYFNKSF